MFYIDDVKITDVTWDPKFSVFSITTYIPDGNHGKNYPQAYGHFTFANSATGDKSYRLLKAPAFVNTP